MDPDEEFVTYLNPDLRKLNDEVIADSDNYQKWETFVKAAEGQEQGLSRNSSPAAIAAYRGVYDRILAKFPLFFGYWKKYADLEFAIAGTEAAELVYERGVASVPYSHDLWRSYCSFKCDTTHDPEPIRELYERAASAIGTDFMAHTFWDTYIEYEERIEAHDRIFEILSRVITIPNYQYAKYFERFNKLAEHYPVKKYVPSELHAQWKAEFEMANGTDKPDSALEAALKPRAEEHHMQTFRNIQEEVNKRWAFEQHIKRHYFHVEEVSDEEVDVWRRYLDHEETRPNNYDHTVFLYERCLVALAYYDDFWLRYARWMQSQRNYKPEEVRHIYMRASCFYTAIARPQVRLQWALFEEREGRTQIATDIYEAILIQVPDMTEAITAAANLQRRLYGAESAALIYSEQAANPQLSAGSKAILTVEWAKLLWQFSDEPGAARELFRSRTQNFAGLRVFWEAFLEFEIAQKGEGEDDQRERIKGVVEEVRKNSQLPSDVVKELCAMYMQWLVKRGTKDVAKEWLELDRAVNGSVGC